MGRKIKRGPAKVTSAQMFAHASSLVAEARRHDFRTLIGRFNRRDWLRYARKAYRDAQAMAAREQAA